MNGPRFYRGLRIAVSAVCGILCVLLIVLWVRSWWWADWIDRFDNAKIQTNFGSASGTLIYSHLDWKTVPGVTVASHGWEYKATRAFMPDKIEWVNWSNRPGVFRFAVSHWMLIPFISALATFPWIRWRFSLRTLLIATTLIAVVLATAAYLGLW